MLGTFFIKSPVHEMASLNAANGATSYFYSLEHESYESFFQNYFAGNIPPIPPGKTVFALC